MSTPLPTYEQILELPAQVTREVPPEYIDQNGHMNIGRYLDLGGEAMWLRCEQDLGMGTDYILERGMSTFTAEHHLRYLSELREGDQVSVHTLLIAASAKITHCMSLIVDRTHERLACIMEIILVHMDMTTRRPTPFPGDVAELVAAGIKADDLGWPVPLSGSMGIRKRA